MAPCRICGNARGNRGFTAREMMLGLGDLFEYVECGHCGALQIKEIPADLARYYAPPYYSFQPPPPSSGLKRWLRRRLADHALGGFDPVGSLVARVRGEPDILRGMREARLDRDARILDVGAGTGQTLLVLRDFGFRNLLGVDLYLNRDVQYGPGVEVHRARIADVAGKYDLIMFHHSFEHVVDPAATLAAARDRLKPGGRLLIRTPVVAESWRRYGADWVELDAPRHLHVHTVHSLKLLAARTNLAVLTIRYETYGLELWGSEQYRRGIPLMDPRSHAPGRDGAVFGWREMRRFEEEARALNRSGEAGRAAFWLGHAVEKPGKVRR